MGIESKLPSGNYAPGAILPKIMQKEELTQP